MLMEITKICAKRRGANQPLYEIELNYKANGLFILRPVTGEPYRWLNVAAGELRDNKRWQMFPVYVFINEPVREVCHV